MSVTLIPIKWFGSALKFIQRYRVGNIAMTGWDNSGKVFDRVWIRREDSSQRNAPQIEMRLSCHGGIRRNDPRPPSRAWRCLRTSVSELKNKQNSFLLLHPAEEKGKFHAHFDIRTALSSHKLYSTFVTLYEPEMFLILRGSWKYCTECWCPSFYASLAPRKSFGWVVISANYICMSPGILVIRLVFRKTFPEATITQTYGK